MNDIRHSIVVMTFNQRSTIEEAIQSVLDQTESPYELIVLDDCSTDGTADVAEHCLETQRSIKNWKVVRNDINLGIPRNTRKISDVIFGNVITHLSGDDRLSCETVEKVRSRLVELKIDPEEDLFISIGPIAQFTEGAEIIIKPKVLSHNLFRSAIVKTFPFVKVGCSARLLRAASYPDNVGLWGDWVWDVSICAQRGVSYYTFDKPLYNYRLGAGVGTTTSQRDIIVSYVESAKKIYTDNYHCLGVLEKSYLFGEIYYNEARTQGGSRKMLASFFLFVLNTIFFRDAVLFKSTLVRYIPKPILQRLR